MWTQMIKQALCLIKHNPLVKVIYPTKVPTKIHTKTPPKNKQTIKCKDNLCFLKRY